MEGFLAEVRILIPGHPEIRGRYACGSVKRNGRALADNAPEVMFSIVINRALSDSLRSSTATGRLRPDFPYVALPAAAGMYALQNGKKWFQEKIKGNNRLF